MNRFYGSLLVATTALLGVACGDDDGGAVCQNGVLEEGEACDTTQFRDDATCEDLGYSGGMLTCASDCTFDESGCTTVNNCGDGDVDSDEQCDGTDLGGEDCRSRGYSTGTLSCNIDCTFDETGCSGTNNCGDNTVDSDEDCDGADLDGATCQNLGFSGGELSCTDQCEFNTGGCTGCTNQCTLGDDDRCVGTVMQECQTNAVTGCTEWVALGDCDPQYCNVNSGTAECSETCQPQCSVGQDDQCDGTMQQTCEVNPSSGCAEWVDQGDCAPLNCLVTTTGDASCSASTCVNDCNNVGDLQCDGGLTALEICALGTDGCLHWEIDTDCAFDGAFCDDSGAAPQCSCPSTPQCSSGDVSCCNGTNGDSVCVCGQSALGCWMYQEQTDCAANGLSCLWNGSTHECACNPECNTVGEEQCSGDTRQRCTLNASNCRVWSDIEDCAATSQVCHYDGGSPSQTHCGCQGDCTTPNALRCDTNVLERCEDQGTCYQWTQLEDCAANSEICDLWMGSPACVAVGQCTSTCQNAGDQRCSGRSIETCTAQPNGCNEWEETTNCFTTGEYCDDSGANPVCASTCTDQCDPSSDWRRCNGNTLENCEPEPQGCYVWATNQDCEQIGQVCGPDPDDGYLSCVVPCRNECDLGDRICMYGDHDWGVGFCVVGSQGCTTWEVTSCQNYNDWCGEYAGTAYCYGPLDDPCDYGSPYPACDADGDTRCVGNSVQECHLYHGDNQDCLRWRDVTSCTQAEPYCEQVNATTAQCTATCTDMCPAEGHTTCLTSGQTYTCERNYDGCLDWVLGVDCAANGQYCAMSGLQPAAASCTGDGDNCSAAIPIASDYFQISGEDLTANYTDQFDLTGGTGCDPASGADAVFSIDLSAGQSVIIGEYGELNAVMRVLDACAATTCLMSVHEFNEDNPFTFTAPAAGTYYIVLESYSAFPSQTDFLLEVMTLYADETGRCGDGMDNDDDGLRDCADPDCYGDTTHCTSEVHCADGADNDGDGDTDCADTDCQASAYWCTGTEDMDRLCNDGVDNDGDGQSDCDDSDCSTISFCHVNQGIYQLFDPTDFPPDVQGWRIVFTPGGPNGYTWAATQNAAYFVTPGITGNTTDSFTFDTSAHTITLPFAFPAWGLQTTTVHIRADRGLIIFGDETPNWDIYEDGYSLFGDQLLGMLWIADNNAYESNPANQTQYVDSDYDAGSSRFYWALTFRALQYGTSNQVDIQVVLFDDGEIRMDFITVQADEGMVGITNPGAWDSPPVPQSNFAPDVEDTEGPCNDGIDNDLDGDTDCVDSQCAGLGLCGTEDAQGVCGDGFDNDGDGDVDCVDAGCAGSYPCGAEDHFTTCTDDTDNDGDGEPDYFSDTDCTSQFVWFEDLTTDPGWTNTGGWTRYGNGFYYSDGSATGYLEIGPLDLSTPCKAHLAFELFMYASWWWDNALTASTDQITWDTVPVIYPAYNTTSLDGWSNTAYYWRGVVADLSAYVGQSSVYFRFNTNYDYAAIRDVGLATWNDCSHTSDFTEDFTTDGGWTFTGEWGHGTPSGTGPTSCPTGSCIGTNMAGDLTQGCSDWGDCSAASPAIDLSGVSNPYLFFQGYVDMYDGDQDGCALFVSPNNTDWYAVGVSPAYNAYDSHGLGNWDNDTYASWQPFEADLSWLGGEPTVYLRFDSLVLWGYLNANKPGCYFDDLVIGHY
jgi:hypothetical protein